MSTKPNHLQRGDLMSTEILSVILSGQLILVVWQVYKELAERKEKKLQAQRASAQNDDALRNMVFKLYRDRMEQKILATYKKVNKRDAGLREALMLLQDDMEFYIKQGGNGLVKELYLKLCHHVRDTLGEQYYVLLVVDSIEEFSRT